ncbi:MAG: potassium-transporting ATPase subunit KdpC [Candidatus Aureabacteria bacterium]|nr:potassium-transporting ATPase subunit KdpC [Candidatus Auribacterota bacterium]
MTMIFAKALRLFLVLTLLTGVVYPIGMTIMAKMLFPERAEGSIVKWKGVPAGSALLAQKFESPRYFHPRPSACDFNTIPSGASNQGPTSTALKKAVQERAVNLRAAHALHPDAPVPLDLLFASGSGLDPHISPAAMAFQMDRVARARGFTPPQRARLEKVSRELIEPPQFGFLGEARVNVLLLNLALDNL